MHTPTNFVRNIVLKPAITEYFFLGENLRWT